MSVIGILLALPLFVVVLLIIAIGFYEARKAYWDYQVREMCAKDGGTKIYEVVKLPPEKFNEWGQINFYKPTQGENALGIDYVFKEHVVKIKADDPELLRYHYELIRKSDSKRLSEAVSYQRGGGDFPAPWQPSVFTCPEIKDAGPNALLMKTFLRGQK